MLPESLSNTKKVFAGVRFDVHQVHLPRHDGGTQQREIVVPPDAVLIVPQLDEQHVVMIRNKRFAIDQELWELPAGTLEPGEDPHDCALREVEEETGYRACSARLLWTFYSSPGFCTEKMHVYLAQGLKLVGQSLDPTEQIEPHVLPMQQVLRMIERGEIHDGKSVAGLLHYERFIADG